MWWAVLICAVVGSVVLSVWRIKKIREEKKNPQGSAQARQDLTPPTTVKRTPPIKKPAPLTMTKEQYREWVEGFAANELLGIDVMQSYNPPSEYTQRLRREGFRFDSINKKTTADISVADSLTPIVMGEEKRPDKPKLKVAFEKYLR